MEFSVGGSHMVMQSFETNSEIFGFQQANPNPNIQGLSLSLYNPMEIASHQEQLFMDDGGGRLNLFQSSHHLHHQQQLEQPFVLKKSKYVIPAQELLNEFCNLGNISDNNNNNNGGSKKKEHKGSIWNEGCSSSSLYTMDFGELQKRKAKLQSMLDEVHRRYRRYCDEMRSVVSAFEAIAGENSANVYATLASKAMSRHFRCLKDGITGQLQVTKMALGEKDGNSSSNNAIAPGTTRGETPRLKRLEQCLRQQKAFHQAAVMESQPWRPQRGLPERSVSVLRAWLFEHFLHPYPSDVDKHILARQTGLSRSQVSNWFINARVRLWKPMVEEMYLEELKEEGHLNPNENPSSPQVQIEDQKPVPGFHIHNDSDSLSSIINNNRNPNTNNNPNFGVVDLDFSSYNASNHVSLTLGLQQQEQSLLFSREEDDDRGVQFSVLDDEEQNLMQHRNFMGAQLLHDLI